MKKTLLFAVMGMFITVGAMAQENLLLNGSFEEKGEWEVVKKDGAACEFGSFENKPSNGVDACLYLFGSSEANNAEIFVYQKVTLEVGETYVFSGAIKAGDINKGDYWYTQLTMMPAGDWDIAAKGDPDWNTWGVDNSIIFDVGSHDQEGDVIVDNFFKDLDDTNYTGSFLGEDYEGQMWTSGDTVQFTVPQNYVKDPDRNSPHDYEDLGAEGTEVEFYFIIYCGAAPNGGAYECSVDEFQLIAYVDPSTTVPGLVADADFTVYPNPVGASLNVSNATEIRSISVLNVVGQEVLRQNTVSGKFATINTSGLDRGVYFIKLSDANGVISSKKFIRK